MWWSDDHAARRTRRAWIAACAAAPLAALLQGCGFKLRAPPQLPFQRIALTGFKADSPLAQALRESLAQGVTVVNTTAQAEVVLVALLDAQEKSVVASTSAVQVREVQLRTKFGFRAQAPGGHILLPAAELRLTRDLSYNETQALAKEQEEAALYREMRADVVAQVMRRLSALKL
jgi:LPS-assembly lipoprotein